MLKELAEEVFQKKLPQMAFKYGRIRLPREWVKGLTRRNIKLHMGTSVYTAKIDRHARLYLNKHILRQAREGDEITLRRVQDGLEISFQTQETPMQTI